MLKLSQARALRRRVLVGVGLGAALAACGSSGAATGSSSAAPSATLNSANPFSIGVVIPLSGPYAAVGQGILQGMNIAVDELNAGNGILGRKVQLVQRDDGGTSAKAVLAAQDLVENAKVDFLLSDAISAQSLAILPYTTQKKIVTISTGGAASLDDAAKYPYNFQLTIPFEKQAKPTVYGAKLAGAHKVAVLTTNDAGGTSNGDALVPLLKNGTYGLSFVDYLKFDPKATDVTPELQKLRGAGADGIITQAPGAAIGTLMRGVRDLNWDVKVVGTNGTVTGDISALVPQSVATQFTAVVMRGMVRSQPDQVDPPFRTFADQLGKQGPVSNLQVPMLHRDLTYLVAWAYNKAGSTDQDKVKAAFESMRSSSLPNGTSLVYPNPGFTATEHGTRDADYSHFWGAATTSKIVEGTFLGQPMTLPSSDT
jgi:branched-chain amino acid transport system substrate-binding protein